MECFTHENYYSDSPAHPSPLYIFFLPRPQFFFFFADLDSLLKFTSLTTEPQIQVEGFVLKKILIYIEILIVPYYQMRKGY